MDGAGVEVEADGAKVLVTAAGADTTGGAKSGERTGTAAEVGGAEVFALVNAGFGTLLNLEGGSSSSESNNTKGLSSVPNPDILIFPLPLRTSARESLRGGGGGPDRLFGSWGETGCSLTLTVGGVMALATALLSWEVGRSS